MCVCVCVCMVCVCVRAHVCVYVCSVQVPGEPIPLGQLYNNLRGVWPPSLWPLMAPRTPSLGANMVIFGKRRMAPLRRPIMDPIPGGLVNYFGEGARIPIPLASIGPRDPIPGAIFK